MQESIHTEKLPKRPLTGKADFRVIGVRLLAADLEANIDELVPKYAEELRGNREALESLCKFALLHLKATTFPEPNGGGGRGRANEALKKERKLVAEETAKQIMGNVLEHGTPYGKPVNKCSGAELYKLGGWYRVLSKLAGGRDSKTLLCDTGTTEAEALAALQKQY
jgi:hypothetical protein